MQARETLRHQPQVFNVPGAVKGQAEQMAHERDPRRQYGGLVWMQLSPRHISQGPGQSHESQHGGREPGPVVEAQHRHARDGLQLPNWVCLVSDASDDGFGLAGRPVSDRGVAPHIRGSWFREELGTRSGKVDMHGAASATSFAGSTGDTPIVDTYVLRTYCRIRCYGSWSRRSALRVDAQQTWLGGG